MTSLYISVGSNIEREKYVSRALDLLAAEFSDLELSPVYESEAAGFTGAPFYNLVAGAETEHSLPRVLALLRTIEERCGRRREGPKFGPRTMDLDLLLYGDFVGTVANVELPRPEILSYSFILRPLAELAPGAHHPVSGRSWGELWQAYEDKDAAALRQVFL